MEDVFKMAQAQLDATRRRTQDHEDEGHEKATLDNQKVADNQDDDNVPLNLSTSSRENATFIREDKLDDPNVADDQDVPLNLSTHSRTGAAEEPLIVVDSSSSDGAMDHGIPEESACCGEIREADFTPCTQEVAVF